MPCGTVLKCWSTDIEKDGAQNQKQCLKDITVLAGYIQYRHLYLQKLLSTIVSLPI